MRSDWVEKRKNDKIRTTVSRWSIARRESLPPELVRSEVARGA
jgi:hypothetical protein